MGEMPLSRVSRVRVVRFCSTLPADPTTAPIPTPPTRPSHILYHLLKTKGPLTRPQIEEELAAAGLFDMTGHTARRRLLLNKRAVAHNNRVSTPSKPVTIPKNHLQPLIPTKHHGEPEKKILSAKRYSESLLPFVVPTQEFKMMARINRQLAFPSRMRINRALRHLKRRAKIETKPKPHLVGDPVRGRRQFVYRLKEGHIPVLTPDEFAASGGKAQMEARAAQYMARRSARILDKKEAWASYINGESPLGSLIDPRIMQAREEARFQKLQGLKA